MFSTFQSFIIVAISVPTYTLVILREFVCCFFGFVLPKCLFYFIFYFFICSPSLLLVCVVGGCNYSFLFGFVIIIISVGSDELYNFH